MKSENKEKAWSLACEDGSFFYWFNNSTSAVLPIKFKTKKEAHEWAKANRKSGRFQQKYILFKDGAYKYTKVSYKPVRVIITTVTETISC